MDASIQACNQFVRLASRVVSNDLRDFARWLAHGRKLGNITPDEIAERFKIAPGTVSRWENGHSSPPESECKSIIEFLQVRVFCAAIKSALAKDVVSEKDLARQFGVSRPTIHRWANGINAAHPALRGAILDYIEEKGKE